MPIYFGGQKHSTENLVVKSSVIAQFSSFLRHFRIAEFRPNFRRQFPPKFPPPFFKHFFRFLARALAPRQKSEKMPSFTAEPATHSAGQPPIPPKFRQISEKNGNLENYLFRKLLNIVVNCRRKRAQIRQG